MSRTMVVGSYSGGSTDDIIYGAVSMYLSSPTEVTILRGGTTGTIESTVYVIEFYDGTSVQRGEISFTGFQTSLTDPLTPVTLGDSMAWIPSGWINTGHCTTGGTGSSDNLDVMIRVRLTSTIEITGERNNNGFNDAVLHWEVVEWAVGVNFHLDLEVQWTDVPDSYQGTEVAIKTGAYNGTEQLRIDFWNSSSQWQTLGYLASDSWNNFTLGSYLASSNFTVRFKGASETSDAVRDTWQIDASLIRLLGKRNFKDPVDNDSSDIDSSPDIGIHSDFTAQQSGPDSTYDVLTESKFENVTLVDAKSFEGSWPPSGWTATGGWNAETNQAHDGIYSADIDGGFFPGTSGDLDTPSFNCSGVHAIYVSFWFRDEATDFGELILQFWDGNNWDDIQDLTGYSEYTWHYFEFNVTDSQYYVDDFQVRFTADTLGFGEHFYIDEVTIIKEVQVSNDIDLDLEIQWTDLVYDLPNEELCIYAGSMGAEDLVVEIWNTTSSSWDTIFSDLTASSWNNASITDWLTSETVTVRYRGATTTGDTVKDQWEIDIALIHAWQDGTAEYSLDMEYRWTDARFYESGEELCIYGGSMGTENILVDVWYNDAWNNVFADLSPGWNNVSVTQYLNSSTFTIRVRDGNPTSDALLDTWEIDVSLLHVWGATYTAEVEFEGTSNLYEWPQIEWTVDSAWTNASIRVEIQLYNYTDDTYPASGYGFSNYTSGPAGIDETESQVITDRPMDFRNAISGWKIKMRGEHTSQFELSVDYIALNTTYYDEYTAQTEFVFTDVTDNQSPNLNFTVVSHNSIDGATVTLQVWNYTSSSFPSSGMGYLSYISTGANNTRWLNVTNNAQSCLSGSYARIRVTSVYSTTDSYQQLTNLVRLLQEESILVNDYALRVTNSGAALYTVRLVRVSDSNIDRIINCTIYFRSGETQLQVIDGIFTLTTGTSANLPAASSLDILIDASTIHLQYASVIEAELEVLRSGTSMYTKFPIQFTIT